ncbi:MAG: PDZ domain-containing protein [Rhabdochlamydiaceae bacterium]|nr:PDZ domain-containing protein [Rhabdochlamydiaceae bacterium]
MKFHWLKSLLFFLVPLLLHAKQLELTSHDTRVKIDEILRAHATHHTLNQELISRTLNNFFQELDPNFCYLIEPEVLPWTNASQEKLDFILNQIQKEDFSAFNEMYGVMLKAIERRRAIEAKLVLEEPLENVDSEEFKDMTWVKTEEELETRLRRIQGLQMKTARRILSSEEQGQFKKRLEKRRITREDGLLCKGDHSLYTYVLKAAASALDSQTSYFTPSEANQLMMQVQQRLFGIGAQLRDDLNGLTIMRVLDNSPLSQHPEVEIGDRIIAVNQEPVIGLDISDAVDLIRGPEGTSVTITFLRQKENAQEEKFDVKIVRGEIVLKESRFDASYEPFGSGVIGILKLHSFYQDSQYSSGTDLLDELEKLKKEHKLQGIILDLRNNTGGLLPQAVSVAGLFMSKGIVVSVKDNTGYVQHLRNLESQVAWDGPLVILTNKFSASASEIVAQTLQEYGRALIVGDSETFGKGTFQLFTLESANFGKVNTKGEYKVTRGRYYTVSGKTPQKVGVKADIAVPGHFSEMEIGERFAKYPLEPDEIGSSFEDDLSDIPLIHRYQVAKLYKPYLQPVVTTYKPFLPQLSTNSSQRLENDNDHQNMIKIISNKSSANPPSIGSNDIQLQEAVNIMKDLVFLKTYRS